MEDNINKLHRQHGELVEHNINKLSVQQTDKVSHIQSPTWRALRQQEILHVGSSRVKKLSKVFEEKSKVQNAKPNWWLDETLYNSPSISTPKPRNSIGRMTNNSPKNSTSNRIVQEFLQKEQSYIEALERGVSNYVDVISRGGEEVPAVLRYQTFRLFGNIEEILKIHKELVLPRLLLCNGNARLIAETISSFVQNDLFYCYIVYGINQRSAEQLISQHLDFFENLRSSTDDLLGVNSFTLQPIQKLPRYKMLFDEMMKELARDMATNKLEAAACCIAEKHLQRLLIRLDEALSVNDIVEVNLFGVMEQMNTITTLQNLLGLNINEPMLMIMPKTSNNFPYRSPVRYFSHIF